MFIFCVYLDVPEIEDVQGRKRVAPPTPYRPNPWAKMVLILARDHSRDSIKGHPGDFGISTYERVQRGLKPEFIF